MNTDPFDRPDLTKRLLKSIEPITQAQYAQLQLAISEGFGSFDPVNYDAATGTLFIYTISGSCDDLPDEIQNGVCPADQFEHMYGFASGYLWCLTNGAKHAKWANEGY